MKRDDQLEPTLTHQFKAQEGVQGPSQENKQKTGRDQSLNVTSRNTSTNNLSNKEPAPIEKKIQFLNHSKGKKHVLNHQQEATPKLTTLKTNKQNNKQNKLKNSRKKQHN